MQDRTGLVVRSADVLRNMVGGLASRPRAAPLAGIYSWVGVAIGWLLMILRWPVMAIWGDDPLVRRAISLAVAFIGAWAAVTLGLYLFGVIEEVDRNLWTLRPSPAPSSPSGPCCWRLSTAERRDCCSRP